MLLNRNYIRATAIVMVLSTAVLLGIVSAFLQWPIWLVWMVGFAISFAYALFEVGIK